MKFLKFILPLYIAVILALFLYSYTQVDLSLTLSKFSIWQTIEKSFQYIGYFNRPLSAMLYVAILFLLFGFYILFLFTSSKNILNRKKLWVIILVSAGVLTFAYNAFSYDIFNYIFDAKIITFYHQNPYMHMALNYPHDPMLSFMHWVQRTYPYGPVWLVATVPLSFLGMQFFLPTFFLFKVLASVSFLACAWAISKILKKTSPKNEVFGTVLFALNPLVIIESLVSAHNDVFMIALALWAFYFILINKYIRSLLLLTLSILVKFATGLLIPIFLFVLISIKFKKKINWQAIFIISSLLMIIPVILASVRTNFQPWYLLFVFPFAALVGKKYYGIIPIVVMSFFALCEYIPFIFQGNWNPPIPNILSLLTASGIVISVILTTCFYIRHLLINKS